MSATIRFPERYRKIVVDYGTKDGEILKRFLKRSPAFKKLSIATNKIFHYSPGCFVLEINRALHIYTQWNMSERTVGLDFFFFFDS